MKHTVVFALFVCGAFFNVGAAVVPARYLRIDIVGIGDLESAEIFEIRVLDDVPVGFNLAAGGGGVQVTTNGNLGDTTLLNNGITNSNPFVTGSSQLGRPSLDRPHRVQFDWNIVSPVAAIEIYLGAISADLVLSTSEDGVNWLDVGVFKGVSGLVTSNLEVQTNEPFPRILSAKMRPGTSLLDVKYIVWDSDDAAVKCYPLAFIDGVRSFSNVLRPVTFLEGTGANIGDSVPANTIHSLTWDVGEDWNIDLGQVKFEIMSRDSRDLLAIDWLRIPAQGGIPELTISKKTSTSAEVLNALFWVYASMDVSVALANGVLRGSASSGAFSGSNLASGSALDSNAYPFLFKVMNIDPASSYEVEYAGLASTGNFATSNWHAVNRPYQGISALLVISGGFDSPPEIGRENIVSIAAGNHHVLFITSSGRVLAYGSGGGGEATSVPLNLSNVIAVAGGGNHSLALKGDGTVVGWGGNDRGQINIPVGLSGVVAIAAGRGDDGRHSLALKNNGTIVGWGNNTSGQATPPAGLNNVIAIAAGDTHSLALKNDGTVVGWGNNGNGRASPPAGLANVVAIAAGQQFSLALKADGSVVAWGDNGHFVVTNAAGLSQISAISAGEICLALKSDGTIIKWGWDGGSDGLNITAGPPGALIAAGKNFGVVYRNKRL